ncbi:hypothetical protein ACH5RR_017086 [Cinchona calisaya]|uniref:Uncharacterized protein n=1 Tax=Cinchona calisaya TaxID=153742 RepID=A0ABD3A1F2_9GENT
MSKVVYRKMMRNGEKPPPQPIKASSAKEKIEHQQLTNSVPIWRTSFENHIYNVYSHLQLDFLMFCILSLYSKVREVYVSSRHKKLVIKADWLSQSIQPVN